MRRSRFTAVASSILLLLCSVLSVNAAQQSGPGDWLETSPPANWNSPGAAVPTAPPPYGQIDPRCSAQERSPESAEEEQLAAAGWHLFNAAQVGWGVRVVDGLVDYDGMCRPNQYNGFVFADGQFAGTVSPTPMDSRTDGSGRVTDLRGPGTVLGQFVRYADTDPLCCPSSTFIVSYVVDRSGDPPVLVPQQSSRSNPP